MKSKQLFIALGFLALLAVIYFIYKSSRNETVVTQHPANSAALTNSANSNSISNSNAATTAPPAPPMKVGDTSVGGAATPVEAFKMLYAAVKAKNSEAIKRMMSQKTMPFVAGVSSQQGITVEKYLENGLIASTLAPTLPKIRDERVKDDMGAIEVWNEKDKRWEDVPFIKEADGWKLAVGDAFAGNYKSPGRGQAQIESEMMTNKAITNVSNTNAQPKMIIPNLPANAGVNPQ